MEEDRTELSDNLHPVDLGLGRADTRTFLPENKHIVAEKEESFLTTKTWVYILTRNPYLS